jgi:1-acyl-sn-glycerol-3-phosphate acyltransferase
MFNKLMYSIGGKIVKTYSKIMLRMDISKHYQMPSGTKIIVANHPTTTDPFILTSVSNGQAAVLIKDILFEIPIFGTYLHMAGHVPVIRGKGIESFDRALALLKRGVTVIVFIEGDLSKFIHKVDRPKTGAIRLAMLSGKPIIPIGISVKEKNIKTIKSIIKGVQEFGKWYFKGPYAITIGKPIRITGNTDNKINVRHLSVWLREKISLLENEGAKRLNKSR